MTTDDQGKKDESSNTPQDRLEAIIREEKEDASDYYAQGDSKNKVNEAAEFSKPVEPIPAAHEEMNMLKAVAFLGFGMAALAIIFILFFIRDLDTRVMGVDGTVSSLEDKLVPLQKHVDDSFSRVDTDISGLKNKLGNYERSMAVMELKRALVAVQGISVGNSSDIKAKSDDVVADIEALLVELGAGTVNKGMPAGIVSLEEAPAPAVMEAPAPVEEPAHAEEATHAEEPVVEEVTPAEEDTHAVAEPVASEIEPAEEAPAQEESSAGENQAEDDDEEEEEEEDKE